MQMLGVYYITGAKADGVGSAEGMFGLQTSRKCGRRPPTNHLMKQLKRVAVARAWPSPMICSALTVSTPHPRTPNQTISGHRAEKGTSYSGVSLPELPHPPHPNRAHHHRRHRKRHPGTHRRRHILPHQPPPMLHPPRTPLNPFIQWKIPRHQRLRKHVDCARDQQAEKLRRNVKPVPSQPRPERRCVTEPRCQLLAPWSCRLRRRWDAVIGTAGGCAVKRYDVGLGGAGAFLWDVAERGDSDCREGEGRWRDDVVVLWWRVRDGGV